MGRVKSMVMGWLILIFFIVPFSVLMHMLDRLHWRLDIRKAVKEVLNDETELG